MSDVEIRSRLFLEEPNRRVTGFFLGRISRIAYAFAHCTQVQQSTQPQFNNTCLTHHVPTNRSTLMSMEQRAKITSLI